MFCRIFYCTYDQNLTAYLQPEWLFKHKQTLTKIRFIKDISGKTGRTGYEYNEIDIGSPGIDFGSPKIDFDSSGIDFDKVGIDIYTPGIDFYMTKIESDHFNEKYNYEKSVNLISKMRLHAWIIKQQIPQLSTIVKFVAYFISFLYNFIL